MTTVHCIIEADRDTGSYVGRLVGFPHFEIMGATADDVEAKLRRHILSIHESGEDYMIAQSALKALMRAGQAVDAARKQAT